MKAYKGFLIDLDGTVYRGDEKIAEAVSFVNQLADQGLPYLFVTNNSSQTPETVANKLTKMGVHATAEHVFTTSQATAKYIKGLHEDAKVYKIGMEGLEKALLEEGLSIVEKDADIVVVGIDKKITYEKLAQACIEVRRGATFIATNGDVAIPTERGLLPGNGSLVSVISVSTGIQPTFIGKPEAIIIEQALSRLGTSKEETVMIGDNYQTDILAGIHAGIDTIMVHTGVTSKEALELEERKPTFAVQCLSEWIFAESEKFNSN